MHCGFDRGCVRRQTTGALRSPYIDLRRAIRSVHDGFTAREIMLRALPAAASLVVCSTCRFSQDAYADSDGRSAGSLFANALQVALAQHACRDRIEIQAVPCLFACSSYCTVFLRSSRRLGYLLGRFAPSAQHALALLDYVAHYLDSENGVVAYENWPDGVKGHFLARVPPEGFVWDAL